MSELTVLEKQSNELVEKAKSYSVTNQRTYEESATYLQTINLLGKKIEGFFMPTVNKFKEAKKKADEGRKAEVDRMMVYLNPVKEAKDILQRKCKEYENECFRKAEEERKAKEEAERKRLEAEAKEAEAWDDKEKAEEIKQEAENVEVKAEAKVHKVAGLGITRRWKAKVIDKSKIPLEYMEVNMVALNKLAVQQKDNFNIPGAEAINE